MKKVACFVASVQAAEYAVLVAGSNGFGNYRHQADIAHAYQIVKEHGIPEENIITFMYDDIANNSQNPFKGKIFNKPTEEGTAGKDVYAGVKIDYSGDDVTADNFLNALTGTGKGKVLKSTEEDTVFINYSDHGATGLVAFPNGVLHREDWLAALETMRKNNMFKKLVVYLEACESGSMFDGIATDENIYVTTASNPTESSWGCYCGSEAMIDGQNVGSCLGDLYSVSWMEDTDANPKMTETLEEQFTATKKLTDKSEVCQYGDVKGFNPLTTGDFQGATPTTDAAPAVSPRSSVSTRDAELQHAYHRYLHAPAEQALEAAEELKAEIANRENSERVYRDLVALAYPGEEAKQEAAWTGATARPLQRDCELAVHTEMASCPSFRARSGFALKFQRVTVNLCADAALGWPQDLPAATAAARTACRGVQELVV